MLTFYHINYKLLEVQHWSKNQGSVPTYTADEDDVDEVVDSNTSKIPSPLLPFFLESVEIENTPPDDYLPPW